MQCEISQGGQRTPEQRPWWLYWGSRNGSFRSAYLIWPPSSITQLHIFLLLDTIEVLMQSIQEE